MPDTIITIPAYNEEHTIASVIDNIHSVMRFTNYGIVVVSDGSTDKTEELARKAGAEVHTKPHSGLANTFRLEMTIAVQHKPKLIIHTDADGQYVASDMIKLIDKIDDGYDLVLGNRLDGYIEYMPTNKKLLNRLGSIGFSLLLMKYMPDITTGFRAFTPEVAKIELKSNFTYTIEQTVRARRLGYKIGSVPITFLGRTNGHSKLMKGAGHYLLETIKNMKEIIVENATTN